MFGNLGAVIRMTASAIVIFDIFVLMYNLAWLGFLTYKHYGQVTTKAGHIFELNVLFNYILYIFFTFILTDFEALPSGKMTDILHTTLSYSHMAALAGSEIETVIFLKTLNVNTMMTNTAGTIILMMTICCFGVALIITFVMPSSWKVNEICEYFKPEAFYRLTIPTTVVLVLNLAVIGFAVFRSHQFRKTRDNEEMFGVEGPGHEIEVELGNTRLFTIQGVMSEMSRESEQNPETPTANVEDDIIVEDIELVNLESNVMIRHLDGKRKVRTENVEDDIDIDFIVVKNESVYFETDVMNRELDEKRKATSRNLKDDIYSIKTQTSLDLLSINAMIDEVSQLEEFNLENELYDTQCLPEIGLIQTLNKYLKNALISLLLVTSELPWNLIALYAFFTSSGCENPTLSVLSEITLYSSFPLHFFLPFLIKIKLDRLSL